MGFPNSLHYKEMVTNQLLKNDQLRRVISGSPNRCPRFSLVTLNALNGNRIWKKAQGVLQPSWWAPRAWSPPQQLSQRESGPVENWAENLWMGAVRKMTVCYPKCKRHLADRDRAVRGSCRQPGWQRGLPGEHASSSWQERATGRSWTSLLGRRAAQAGRELLGGFGSQLRHIQSHGSHGDREMRSQCESEKGSQRFHFFFSFFSS